jgi:hypothetical protein
MAMMIVDGRIPQIHGTVLLFHAKNFCMERVQLSAKLPMQVNATLLYRHKATYKWLLKDC